MNGPFAMVQMPISIYCGECSDGLDNGTGIHCTLTGDTKDYYDQCIIDADNIGVPL